MRVKLLFIFLVITVNTIKGQTLKEAQYFLDRSDYKKAIELFDKIKNKAIKQKNVFEIVKAQNGIADCYTDLGVYYKSLSLLKENLKLLNSYKTKNYKLLAETHLQIANNYDNLFFFDEYLIHCHQYYYKINKAFPKKEIYKALYYAYVGRYYNVKYQIDKANFYTETALKIYHKNKKDMYLIDVFKLYNAHSFTIRNTPVTYSGKTKYLDTLSYYLNKRFLYDNIKKAKMFISRNAFNFDMGYNWLIANKKEGRYYADIAISDYKKALDINNRFIGFNYDASAKINGLKSLLYLVSKDYSNALKECDEGIERVSDKNILSLGFSRNNYQILTLLRQKHLVLDELNKSNPKKERQLQIIDNLLLMEKIWDRYSQDQIDNNNDFMSNMYNQNPYTFLFQAYLKIYEITIDKKYLDKIHEYDEKNKYNSLLLTAYLTKKEKKEKQELYKERQEIYLLYDEYILSKNNKLRNHALIKEKLLRCIKDYNQKECTSDLFKQSKIVSIKEIQKELTPKDAVVSFLRTEIRNDNLYAKIITKDKLLFVKVNDLKIKLEYYYRSKVDSLNTALKNSDYKSFKNLSQKIYKDVFENIERHLSKEIKHIEIIPSAEFSDLPFEVLLFKDSKSNDFRKLPYLVQKYNFSYSLSSSITKLNNNRKRKIFDKMAIFSPTFYGKKLSQLDISKKGAKVIAEYYKANYFDGENANIEAFKTSLTNNKIISIYSHGQSFNDFENEKKGIYFSDGFLNLNEIYKLKSNCDFLILGACETGYGGKEKGEGNISLARAFSSIGVKSMMLASWKIDEETTMEITESFFKYLDEGYTKSEALQKAKLDFLKTADTRTANPYYWAGLNIVGNNDTIKLSRTNYIWYLILIFPVTGGLWYFRKRRRKVNSLL